MRIAVLSDTHIKRTGKRALPAEVYRRLESADAILHAGDIVVQNVLDDLARFAPVHAVRGNNDYELNGLPERLELDLNGVPVGMIHDAGPSTGRERRMAKLFPKAAVVVYGHSHIPLIVRAEGCPTLFNPGSPTDKRRQPHFTMGTMTIEDSMPIALSIQRL